MHGLPGPAFGQQVVHAALLGDEVVIGDLVGEDPVDLLRHAAVPAAQAALQVAEGDAQLVGGDRPRQGAVHVTDHEHEVRALLVHHAFQAQHDVRHLGVRRAGLDAQPVVGRKAELLEEDIGHPRIEVLAGMHQLNVQVGIRGGHLLEAGDLDEVGACAHDDEHLPHPSVFFALRVAMMNSVLGVSLTFRAGAPAMVQ